MLGLRFFVELLYVIFAFGPVAVAGVWVVTEYGTPGAVTCAAAGAAFAFALRQGRKR